MSGYWYADNESPGLERWYDTDHNERTSYTRPAAPPPVPQQQQLSSWQQPELTPYERAMLQAQREAARNTRSVRRVIRFVVGTILVVVVLVLVLFLIGAIGFAAS